MSASHPALRVCRGTNPIYLDYNATTPVDESVARKASNALLYHFGNPSSSHAFGQRSRREVEDARSAVRQLLHAAADDDVVFTSGATESINWSIQGVIDAATGLEKATFHVVTSTVEHFAVLEACKRLESQGHSATYLPVDQEGFVSVESVVAAIRPETRLVSLMHANNEIGTVQPITEVGEAIARMNGERSLVNRIVYHVDASQSIGKIPVDVLAMRADLVSVAGHKFYGPKGIGCLYHRASAPWPLPLLLGASQEGGHRAGTENIALIVGLGEACRQAAAKLEHSRVHMHHLRMRLVEQIQAHVGGGDDSTVVFGAADAALRLPNTLSIGFRGVRGPDVLRSLRDKVAVSSGAACHSTCVSISHVLEAIGAPRDAATGAVRISVGRYTTEDDVDQAAQLIAQAVSELRQGASVESVAESLEQASSVPPTKPQYMEDTTLVQSRGVVTRVLPTSSLDVMRPPRDGCSHVVVLDSTIFHPQGGGQPSDIGVMRNDGGTFEVRAVRKGPSGSTFADAILHFGRFMETSECDITDAAEAVPIPSSPRSSPTEEGADEGKPCAASPWSHGATVNLAVRPSWRSQCARLHSAGHLLDWAMRQIGLGPSGGLLPDKGYHFPDSPSVTYKGVIPADRRDSVMAELQEACDRIISADAPTLTETVPPFATPDQWEALGVPQEMHQGLPEDQPIRVVAVGDAANGCPCGGTHVKRASVIGRVVITRVKSKKGKTTVSYEVHDE